MGQRGGCSLSCVEEDIAALESYFDVPKASGGKAPVRRGAAASGRGVERRRVASTVGGTPLSEMHQYKPHLTRYPSAWQRQPPVDVLQD